MNTGQIVPARIHGQGKRTWPFRKVESSY